MLEPNSQIEKPFANLFVRSTVLFTNFFLIIMALYQLKPASRSLLLESHGSSSLPYVWIGSALVLLVTIGVYHHILNRYSRLNVVLGSCLTFLLLLLSGRVLVDHYSQITTIGLYIFVDIFGVILVEQFWSLANSIYSTREGKRWYGWVGTGGLIGGVVGGGSAAFIISYTPLETADLLLVAAAIVALIYGLTLLMSHLKIYSEKTPLSNNEKPDHNNWRLLIHNRYLMLIASALLLAQLVSPIVEYQFLSIIEKTFDDMEKRTAVLSLFFSILGAISIFINLLITPWILRSFGVLSGLLVQPIVLATSAFGFMSHPTLYPAATMKISDRGLSYSINRASKELLYIPVDPDIMYRAKAWIDMFGYRIFKVFGSFTILALTQWTSFLSTHNLGWAIIGGCLLWIVVLVYLFREYQVLHTHLPKKITYID